MTQEGPAANIHYGEELQVNVVDPSDMRDRGLSPEL